MPEPRVYVALVHYPVINKEGKIIASSVTNLDIHDISRICRTYGAKAYYIVQPLREQRELVKELIEYWQNGYGRVYNPDREDALKILKVVPALKVALDEIARKEGRVPLLLGTDAREKYANISFARARELVWSGEVILLLLGTAWGLAPKLIEACPYVLEPIRGRGNNYNHLSVRAAAAIILDRLLGESWWKRI
ncbi:RNA methyltransferase [Thermodesulfatator atlanticus]|uniref:RNA methyltransferase n=1 Tax=Thermodesulfatator atlanticus TaxID=501497 RepID=UPI0003B49CE2|nr:RNA methyltransferase [Thermodesulfatator atlanticus]